MAANKKPAEELVIKNPQYNRSGELISFDGIKLVNKQADKSDPKTMELIKKVQALPRKSPYTGSSAPRVKINEKEYALSYKFFTADEVTTYNNYRDDHGGKGSGSKASKINGRDVYDKLTALVDKMSSKKGDDWKEAAALVEAFRDDNFIDCLSRDELMAMLRKNK